MIIVNAILLVISTVTITDGYDSFKKLSGELDTRVEWIDQYGSKIRSRSESIKLLDNLADELENPVFSVRHSSKWKNEQCFRIIHIDSYDKGYRLFFQCVKSGNGRNVVKKIKVTET